MSLGNLAPNLYILVLYMSQELLMSTPNQLEKVAADQAGASWQVASNLLVSFKYALADSATPSKLNAISRIFDIIGALAIALGVFLHLPPIETAVIR